MPNIPIATPASAPPKKKRLGLKIAGGVVGAVLALAMVNAVTGNGSDTDSSSTNAAEAPAEDPGADEPDAEPAQEDLSDLTVSQENAVKSAESYLATSHFSKKGLTQQLSSEYGENFSKADAAFAVKYLEDAGAVDWNVEAIEAATSYVETGHFSEKGLIGQLSSDSGEQFSAKQAASAVAHLEDTNAVDWNVEAAEAARSYLETSAFSRQGLIDQLESEYGEQFTHKQAVQAVDEVGL